MSLRIKAIIPIIVILFAIFFRFYRFEEFVTFLGDQGRDAIIIKRIITFEHWPAIGAPSSLGQIFLGPFYYFLIAPFLLLTLFNPLGPALGVALISLIGIIFAYFVVKKEIGFSTSVIFLILALFSSVNIVFSRFSWNPNLLPVFSFFTLYFFYLMLRTKKISYSILFGTFLSFSVQLHHLSFLLFIPIILTYLVNSRIHKKITYQYSNIAISFLSFLFFYSPLVIFDLRHDFLNTKNLIKYFTEGNPTERTDFITRFLDTNQTFYFHVFQTDLDQYLALFISVVIAFLVLRRLKEKMNLFIFVNFAAWLLYLGFFTFFNASRIPHYYNTVYWSFFVVIAWIISSLGKNKLASFVLIIVFLFFYLILNLKSQVYIFSTKGNNQIKNAEKIADSILAKKPEVPYQVVALPFTATDGHIRYFLEIKNKRPLPSETLADPKELYVLCFEKDPTAEDGWCRVLGNAQWQIAAFRHAKIDSTWIVEGIKIYKLIHINN